MLSKWIIKGLDSYLIGEDKNIYKKPFTSEKGKRNYPFKLVKMQYPSRWRLNGEYWSKAQLKQHIKKDPNPVEIYINDPDIPF